MRLTFHRGKQVFILLNILIDSVDKMLVWNSYLTLKLKFLDNITGSPDILNLINLKNLIF